MATDENKYSFELILLKNNRGAFEWRDSSDGGVPRS